MSGSKSSPPSVAGAPKKAPAHLSRTLLGLAPPATKPAAPRARPGATQAAAASTFRADVVPPTAAPYATAQPGQVSPLPTASEPSGKGPPRAGPPAPPRLIPAPAPGPERQALAFAKTVNVATALSPATHANGASASSGAADAVLLAPAIVSEAPPTGALPTALSRATPTPASPQIAATVERIVTPGASSGGSTDVFERSSLIDRLHAPTRWHRTTWLTVWAGLILVLALLIGKLLFGHSSQKGSASTVKPAAEEPRAAPSEVVEPPRELKAPTTPSVEPKVATAPLVEPKAPTAPSVEPASSDSPPPAKDEPSDAPLPRGSSYLTVHSSTPHASVYMMLTRLGPVEERLVIPCGKRFIGIGRPMRDRKEPVWLAPGKTIEIPCGGSLEVTMNPRILR